MTQFDRWFQPQEQLVILKRCHTSSPISRERLSLSDMNGKEEDIWHDDTEQLTVYCVRARAPVVAKGRGTGNSREKQCSQLPAAGALQTGETTVTICFYSPALKQVWLIMKLPSSKSFFASSQKLFFFLFFFWVPCNKQNTVARRDSMRIFSFFFRLVNDQSGRSHSSDTHSTRPSLTIYPMSRCRVRRTVHQRKKVYEQIPV